MNNSGFITALQALSKMIEHAEKMLKSAIEREDWLQAAEKDCYLAGLKQALAIFEPLAGGRE